MDKNCVNNPHNKYEGIMLDDNKHITIFTGDFRCGGNLIEDSRFCCQGFLDERYSYWEYIKHFLEEAKECDLSYYNEIIDLFKRNDIYDIVVYCINEKQYTEQDVETATRLCKQKTFSQLQQIYGKIMLAKHFADCDVYELKTHNKLNDEQRLKLISEKLEQIRKEVQGILQCNT